MFRDYTRLGLACATTLEAWGEDTAWESGLGGVGGIKRWSELFAGLERMHSGSNLCNYLSGVECCQVYLGTTQPTSCPCPSPRLVAAVPFLILRGHLVSGLVPTFECKLTGL